MVVYISHVTSNNLMKPSEFRFTFLCIFNIGSLQTKVNIAAANADNTRLLVDTLVVCKTTKKTNSEHGLM